MQKRHVFVNYDGILLNMLSCRFGNNILREIRIRIFSSYERYDLRGLHSCPLLFVISKALLIFYLEKKTKKFASDVIGL